VPAHTSSSLTLQKCYTSPHSGLKTFLSFNLSSLTEITPHKNVQQKKTFEVMGDGDFKFK
jgi:hypothetical protein